MKSREAIAIEKSEILNLHAHNNNNNKKCGSNADSKKKKKKSKKEEEEENKIDKQRTQQSW